MIDLPYLTTCIDPAAIRQALEDGIAEALHLRPVAARYWAAGPWGFSRVGELKYVQLSKSIIDEFDSFFPCDVEVSPGPGLQDTPAYLPAPPSAHPIAPPHARPPDSGKRTGEAAPEDDGQTIVKASGPNGISAPSSLQTHRPKGRKVEDKDATMCPMYKKMKATNPLKEAHACRELRFNDKKQRLEHLREEHGPKCCLLCEDRLESQPEWLNTVDLGKICFEGRASLRAHILAEHLAPYGCCGKRFGAASKFNKHLKENHDYTDKQISSLREMGSNLSLEMACLVRGLGTCKSKGDFRSRLYKENRKVYDLRDDPPTDRLKGLFTDCTLEYTQRHLKQMALCPAEDRGQLAENPGLRQRSPTPPMGTLAPSLAGTLSPVTIPPESAHVATAYGLLAEDWNEPAFDDYPLAVLGRLGSSANTDLPIGFLSGYQTPPEFAALDDEALTDINAFDNYIPATSDHIPHRTSTPPSAIVWPEYRQITPTCGLVDSPRIMDPYASGSQPYPVSDPSVDPGHNFNFDDWMFCGSDPGDATPSADPAIVSGGAGEIAPISSIWSMEDCFCIGRLSE